MGRPRNSEAPVTAVSGAKRPAEVGGRRRRQPVSTSSIEYVADASTVDASADEGRTPALFVSEGGRLASERLSVPDSTLSRPTSFIWPPQDPGFHDGAKVVPRPSNVDHRAPSSAHLHHCKDGRPPAIRLAAKLIASAATGA
ncbi:hypothetical protein MRX96_028669 [Rhipicephalus microplus]